MRFCPKCGSLMVARRVGGKTILKCMRCGYEMEVTGAQSTLRTAKKIRHSVKEKTVVIDNNIKVETLPKTRDVICPKCGHDEAYYWFVQTRAGDEPPTRFYKCTRCGHVWREYE
ncbi:transcription factor S [Ignicoccus hospitalis]|uniref:DNA-directed RNA polymerase, subunit M n=1 Tax=Ignicoccus hospitalis (strain KIN4/I / DSM 18386 / JCM 14125) TaxID=453591 RepID=A8AAT2_IGNH4|nr:transcription factor S [Ignicoccus hospitalis]ABU82034.1 DNA-directed RNA polymerase, subunit M [Ignicoccus hospitalis KIN4/I]HIH90990.1 transcription factor S [Desulfurococcaceae archaeon]